MDLNTQRLEREVYGVLDWLGDIGGFNEALSWLALFTLFLL